MKKKMYLHETRPKALTFFEILVQIAVVSAIGLFIAEYLFFPSTTASKSMQPAVQPETEVFTNRMAYVFSEPERFDVITFTRRESSGTTGDVLVRRVVGLPGETILIRRGEVYIDGEKLDISEHISEITSDGIASEAIRLGDDEYFVLGDTPANSEDSRSSTIGTVKASHIIGRAWLDAASVTELRLIR